MKKHNLQPKNSKMAATGIVWKNTWTATSPLSAANYPLFGMITEGAYQRSRPNLKESANNTKKSCIPLSSLQPEWTSSNATSARKTVSHIAVLEEKLMIMEGQQKKTAQRALANNLTITGLSKSLNHQDAFWALAKAMDVRRRMSKRSRC